MGFVYFAYSIKKFTDSFTIFLFSSAVLSLLFKISLIVRLPNYRYWLLVYFLLLFPIHEMTKMRVAMAIGLGYFALHLSFNKSGRKLPFVIFGTAAAFQYSVLIFLPFVIAPQILKRFKLRTVILILLLPSALLYISLEYLHLLNPLVKFMLSSDEEARANPFSSLNIFLISILIVGLSAGTKLPENKLPWLYISAMGLGLWYGFMSIPVFAHRLLELTILSYFFWIPYLSRKKRIITMSLFFILAVYMFVRNLYIDPIFS